MVQVQREEMAKDLIQAVTGVYGLCCSHLVHIQNKKKKSASANFASPLLSPSVLLTFPHLLLLLLSPTLSSTLSFCFSSNFYCSHTCFVSLYDYLYLFHNFFCRQSHSSSFSSFLPSIIQPSLVLSLLVQTHCSQTLSSPHINPSLPSSVPHNLIPFGSYIFLHLDTACVT